MRHNLKQFDFNTRKFNLTIHTANALKRFEIMYKRTPARVWTALYPYTLLGSFRVNNTTNFIFNLLGPRCAHPKKNVSIRRLRKIVPGKENKMKALRALHEITLYKFSTSFTIRYSRYSAAGNEGRKKPWRDSASLIPSAIPWCHVKTMDAHKRLNKHYIFNKNNREKLYFMHPTGFWLDYW